MNERYTASSTILTFLVAWAATDQNYFLRPADDHFACALEVKSNIGFKRKVLVQPCSIMAAALGKLRPLSFSKAITFTPVSQRLVSTSGINQENEKGWFSKLLVRRIEPTKESHSRLLSDKEVIYELQTHNMRPDSVEKYLQNYKASTQLIHSRDLHCELVGSWTVQVGDLDQALHLWKYTGGFASIDNAKLQLAQDPDWVKLLTERGGMLRSRHLQYVLAFSYWPPIVPRTGSNIYEVRSYRLKPGTMIEWGNNWARAINYRRNNDEPFAAFFSQIGRLYNVHHMWCYKDLQTRKETREAAWRLPGWDECVAYTVPLIREMHTRILLPTDFSPTQ